VGWLWLRFDHSSCTGTSSIASWVSDGRYTWQPEQCLIMCFSGCDNFTALAVGTAFYNALDMPAGCFPVSRVDPIKDQMTDEWLSGPGRGSSLLEGGIYTHKTPLYNPEAMKGMPISAQVVGRKWEEEKVIAIMQVIDDALGERGFGPGAWDKHMEKAQ